MTAATASAEKIKPTGLCLRPAMKIPKTEKTVRIAGYGERAEDGCRFVPRRDEHNAARPHHDHDHDRESSQPGDPSFPSRVSSSCDDAHARTVPAIVVPAPGADRTVSSPPTAASRSAIPCRPVP